ncbi:MAG TPA: hypothetical protein VFY75_10475 [Solirubrobacterales bacterium]|nr:hypothetical protein [Solirubrobacterales bacterium]
MRVSVKKNALRAGLLALFILGLTATPAFAAPVLTATLTQSPETLPRTDEQIEYTAKVQNTGDAPTSGPISAEIVLPYGGSATGIFKFSASGWTCTQLQAIGENPSKLTCFTENPIAPGAFANAIGVNAQLSDEAPDPNGTTTFTTEGGGAAAPSVAEATYTFTEGFPFGVVQNGFIAGVYGYGRGVESAVSLVLPPTPYKITAVGAETLEMSLAAKATGPQALSAGAAPFSIGETIEGPGIQPGTTITGVSGQKLTLSAETKLEGINMPVHTGTVSGTVSMNRGKELNNVVTTTGFGTMTEGSKVVENVETTSGTFQVGQGIESHGTDYTKAGGHPYEAYTSFGFNVHRTADGPNNTKPTENIRDTVVDAPRGFVGNALASPELCPSVEAVILKLCPPKSGVGGIEVYSPLGTAPKFHPYPQFPNFQTALYAVEPEFGQPAQFAFAVSPALAPITFVPELRAEEGYAVSFRTSPLITVPPLYATNVTLCDFGATFSTVAFGESKYVSCKGPSDGDANPTPLITNPTRCSGPPPATGLKIDSWQHPQDVRTYEFTAPAITDCDEVDFEPEAELKPSNQEADSPTGMSVEIKMPLDGVLDNEGISQASLNTATVTFPKGMSINPAASEGLNACSLAQIKLRSNAPEECPESSRVGQIEIDTPLIRETLTGSIYVAEQNKNPFNSTLGLYMSFDSKRDGVRIKVAGKLVTDPQTGQLTSVFTENPEAPFSRLALNFNEGPRAPLINPPKCGTYQIHAEFSPWSAVNPANPTPEEIVSDDSAYQVTSGPNGSPCPTGSLEPKMHAGLRNNQAGSKSPFDLTLVREDGTQRLTGIDVTPPKGLTAYLKGIPYCSDGALASISAAEETGRAELANPTCPAASQVGTVTAGAGAGPFPFQTPGKVYLAGPYKGAPVSLAAVTPAVAGPFDLGSVVIRNGLYVDPETTQVTTKSDPIPTILHGILLDIRQVRISLDRPGFTAAPTNCEPMTIGATVFGEEGGVAPVSNRFQAAGCESLGFKPKLKIRLFGGTRRGSHPRLVATVTAREGDANIAGASVALPHSEFLDQAHIRTICTRVQFAAKQCPAASIYGEAEATTPLTDYVVKGPVYLRSSNNPLPDLVAALRGPDTQPIEVVLAGRIDSKNGGIRTSFEAVPDQPVSKFVVRMQGGKKGLLVNSRNICKSVNRVTARFVGQNGRTAGLRPVLQNACKKNKKQKKSKHVKR